MARVFSIIDDIARADALRAGEQATINAAQDRARLLQEHNDALARQKVLQKRQDAAFEANQAKFGDIAGDPTAFSQLSTATSRENALNAQAQEKARQRMLAASSNVIKLLTQARDTGGDVLATFDRLSPLFPRLGIDPEQVQPFRDAIAQNPSILDTLSAGLVDQSNRRLKKGVKDGKQVFFDEQTGAIVPDISPIPQQSVSGGDRTLAIKTGLYTNPDGSIRREFVTFPADGGKPQRTGILASSDNLAAIRAQIAQQRITPANARDLSGAKAEGTEVGKAKGKTKAADLPLSTVDRRKLINVRAGVSDDFDNFVANIDKAIALVSPASAGAASLGSMIPGLPPSILKNALENVQGKQLFNVIQRLKSQSPTGATGAGQFSDNEGAAAKASDSAIQQSNPPEVLRANLLQFRDFVVGLKGQALEAIDSDLSRGSSPSQVPDLTDEQTRALSDEQLLNAITGK